VVKHTGGKQWSQFAQQAMQNFFVYKSTQPLWAEKRNNEHSFRIDFPMPPEGKI